MTAFSNAVTIAVIEDDDGHARLIEKNIRRAGVTNPMLHLRSGGEALATLLANDRPPSPLVILLDLNLPDMQGTEILQRLRSHARHRRTPVIVLTTTDDHLEVARCYDLGCNIYMIKPLVYQKFAGAVRQMGAFLSSIELPEPS